MAIRPDGATRGDLAEATALVVGGAILLPVPLMVLFDRLATGWLWGSLAFAAIGAVTLAIGVRWFLVEGPPLVAADPDAIPGLGLAGPEFPVYVRLVEARSRLVAHSLRFAALASGGLLVFVSLGPFNWVVLGLFGASFVADQTMLRPQRWVLDDDGLRPLGALSRQGVTWDQMAAVFWRHYPPSVQPPFPSGERVIVERDDGEDLEFVFHRRHNGTDAEFLVRAMTARLGGRLRLLLPRETGEGRPPIEGPALSESLGSRPE